MTEVLMAIAMLCQVHATASLGGVDRRQLKCQKYYVACYATNKNLPQCVMDRGGK